MTDEELKSLEYNGIMVDDASYIMDELIADLRKVRRQRDYLADQLDKLAPNPYESWLEFVKEYVK